LIGSGFGKKANAVLGFDNRGRKEGKRGKKEEQMKKSCLSGSR